MLKYRVSFEITVIDGNPRKWVPDALWENLNEGENIDKYIFEEINEDNVPEQ